MKKLFALVLVCALLCASLALAEPFTFSNGMQWGMTGEQVKELEGEDCQEGSVSEHVTTVWRQGYRISKYTAQYKMDLLADDTLFMVIYGISDREQSDTMTYLKGAETSLYGEPSEASGAELTNMMNNIQKINTTFIDGYAWQAGDDTIICLTADENYVYLFYMDANFELSQIGVYDTTGL